MLAEWRKPLITPADERIEYAVAALDEVIGKLCLFADGNFDSTAGGTAEWRELRAIADKVSDVMVVLEEGW